MNIINAYRIEIVFKSGGDESFLIESKLSFKEISNSLYETMSNNSHLTFITTNTQFAVISIDDISRLTVK